VSDVRRIAETAAVHFGVSSVYTDYRDAAAAAREASQVLGAAQFGDRRWVEFEGTTIAVLSRSHREADEIINGVLGPLVASTTAATRLRVTLFCYLRNDRHWQATADELGIHRQTLSYRLNRIEVETGLSINRSADLAALWIAFQAWDATRGS
jgi:purine catabolism regulator